MPTNKPKIAKEYVLPTLTEEKVRPHNNVYKSLGSRCLNWIWVHLINILAVCQWSASKCPTPHTLDRCG